jgi:hypothetical protein
VQSEDPTFAGGANVESLEQARAGFLESRENIQANREE